MHYLLVVIILVVIISIQFNSFSSNRRKMHVFKNVFPDKNKLKEKIQEIDNSYKTFFDTIQNGSDLELINLLRKCSLNVDNFYTNQPPANLVTTKQIQYGNTKVLDKERIQSRLTSIFLDSKNDAIAKAEKEFNEFHNEIYSTIENSINDYVEANKGGVSDFHLMKDIVDRNCDTLEEEIQSQIPVPLYLGLAGTMLGILVGVAFLVFDKTLTSFYQSGTESGTEGIEALLGGVAIAMISSILGIILTTIGSNIFKECKNTLEQNKHAYLSNIQTKLLPVLSTDFSASLLKMSQNLQKFNAEFSSNTSDIKEVVNIVTLATKNVTQSLSVLQKMDMLNISQANIDTYQKLKNCIDEIEKFGKYLQGINQYQANTADVIEKMRYFFNSGINQIDSINGKVKEALEKFGADTEQYLDNLRITLDSQIGSVQEVSKKQQEVLSNFFETVAQQMQIAAEKQQEIFKQKLTETTALVEELKNLTAVKASIDELAKQSTLQTKQFAQLALAIEKLTEVKTGEKSKKFQKLVKMATIAGGGIVVAYCLFEIIIKIISFL